MNKNKQKILKKLKNEIIKNNLVDKNAINKTIISAFLSKINSDLKLNYKLCYINVVHENNLIVINLSFDNKIIRSFESMIRTKGYYDDNDIQKTWLFYNHYYNSIERIILDA